MDWDERRREKEEREREREREREMTSVLPQAGTLDSQNSPQLRGSQSADSA